MGENSANLATLIGSRICHDLISPIGAINNGLELLDMSGSLDGPEMELISDSVDNAGARIRFFRVAFGAAGDQVMSRSEVVSILEDPGCSGRLTVKWDPQEPLDRGCVRLVFLSLLCLETAMPYGGNVTVSQDNDNWTIRASTTRLSLDEDLWRQLTVSDASYPITPAHVQFALLPVVAEEAGREVDTMVEVGRITISF